MPILVSAALPLYYFCPLQPIPRNFPERARDYSHISDTEWKLLASDKQKAVHRANDSIQSALGELKDLVFICAALADDSLDPQDRCDIALHFAAIQSIFIFDEIAKCELRKMEIASVSLTGGKKVPVRMRGFFNGSGEQRGCPPTPVPETLPCWSRHMPGPSPVEGASGDHSEHSQLGSLFQTSKILVTIR